MSPIHTQKSARHLGYIAFLFLFIVSLTPLRAQITLKGIVTDSLTGEPLVGAAVYVTKHRSIGTRADLDGKFSLTLPRDIASRRNLMLSASMVGYNTQNTTIAKTHVETGYYWHATLNSQELATVVVTPKKKYTKKGNPAVAIIDKAIANKEKNRISRYSDFSYRLYRRQMMGLATPADSAGGWYFGIPEKTWRMWSDSSALEGMMVRPFSLRERESVRSSIGGKEREELIIGRRFSGLEEALESSGTDTNMEELYPEIDLYANDLEILRNQFPGPMSKLFSTSFYKYYLLDTVAVEGRPAYEIGLVPFSKYSIGLSGTVWIDTVSYSLAKAHLQVPKQANVDWVSHWSADFHYAPTVLDGDTVWLPHKQEIHTFLTPTELIPYSCEVDLAYIYKQYRVGEEAKDSLALDPRLALSAPMRNQIDKPTLSNFGIVERPEPLPKLGEGTIAILDYLHQKPSYIFLAKATQAMGRGFIGLPLNKLKREEYYAELGPIETLFAWNVVEGARFRVGGVTNAKLSQHLFGQGYVAYGLGDKRWKYYGKITYSPIAKEGHEEEYPQRNFYLSAHHDLFVPGYTEDAMYKDGLSTLVGTMKLRNRFYDTNLSAGFKADWSQALHTDFSVSYNHKTPAGDLRYYRVAEDGSLIAAPSFSTTSLYAGLTFVPGRMPRNGRRPVSMDKESRRYPVLNFGVKLQPKGLPGNEHTTAMITAGVSARIYLSLFGFIDSYVQGGIGLGKLDEVNLFTPSINNSFVARQTTFELMRPLEYVSDKYLHFVLNYHMKGLIFNRLPLLRLTGWREVFSIRGYWGDVSHSRKDRRVGELVYPEIVSPMNNHLYLEGSAGIENILNIFSLQYFRRFTKSSIPGAPDWTIKLGMFFSF